jgi:hypothetical protein
VIHIQKRSRPAPQSILAFRQSCDGGEIQCRFPSEHSPNGAVELGAPPFSGTWCGGVVNPPGPPPARGFELLGAPVIPLPLEPVVGPPDIPHRSAVDYLKSGARRNYRSSWGSAIEQPLAQWKLTGRLRRSELFSSNISSLGDIATTRRYRPFPGQLSKLLTLVR